jgi:hypothetical protein
MALCYSTLAQKAKSAGLEIEEETLLVKFLKLFKNKK